MPFDRNPQRQLPFFHKWLVMKRFALFFFARLRLLVAEDVRVTGVEDGHGGSPEGLTTGGTEINLLWGR